MQSKAAGMQKRSDKSRVMCNNYAVSNSCSEMKNQQEQKLVAKRYNNGIIAVYASGAQACRTIRNKFLYL